MQERKINDETANNRLKKIALMTLVACMIYLEYQVYQNVQFESGLTKFVTLLLGGIAILWSTAFTIGGILIFFWNRVFEEKRKRTLLKLFAVVLLDIAIVLQLLLWGNVLHDLILLFASVLMLFPAIMVVLVLINMAIKEEKEKNN